MSGRALGPVDLDHAVAPVPKNPRESGPLRPGARDSESHRLPVRSSPLLEWAVARGRGGDEPISWRSVVVDVLDRRAGQGREGSP